jgi:hypothetical protein
MSRTLTIVGLGGSLARRSRSWAALELALEGAASAGAETLLLDLRELGLPMYEPDDDEPTPAAAHLIESCYGADGMLWSRDMSRTWRERVRKSPSAGRESLELFRALGDVHGVPPAPLEARQVRAGEV